MEGSGRGIKGVTAIFVMDELRKPTKKCSSGVAGLEV